jgi:RimJ/RimL family protein N-acetyltransferase
MALAIRDQFKRFPKLARLSAAMIENNRPAQALAQRMGFRCEATLPAMVVQGGTPRSVVHYGLTRREWEQSVRSRKTKRSGG